MTVTSKLDKAITLVVPSAITREMNLSDNVRLMESYGIMEKAKDSFLATEITFDEYLQLAEMHNINVDSYMETIEHNLVQLQLI